MRISDWSSDVCSSDLFFERVIDRLRHDPEVLSASAATALPGTSAGDERLISARGAAKPVTGYPNALAAHIDDYFADTYQLRLLSGRLFDGSEIGRAHV